MATQPTPRQLSSRLNGAKGGLARAKNLSAARRKEIASKAGTATKDNYGVGFFSHVSKLRKAI